MKRSALLSLLLLLALAACKSDTPPPQPEAQPPVSAASPPTSAPAADHAEPAPGSLAVEPIGPPAPTVLFLAGLKGFTEPCGCTLDVLVGGLDRITGYAEAYRAKVPGAVMLDAGNTLFDEPQLPGHRVAQEQAKADVIVEGLKTLGVASTTPGPNDLAMGRIFYLDKLRAAGVEVLAANVRETPGDLPLGPGRMLHTVGGLKLGVVGVVEPDLFTGVEGLTFSDPVEAVKREVAALKKEGATTFLVVDHGRLAHAKSILEAVPEVHFVIVGHEPRETDAVDQVQHGWTLEAYDQGRYLGVLQLYPQDQPKPTSFANARQGSQADVERVDRRIEQLDAQISRLPPATPGNEPEILLTLRQQLNDLKAERERLKNAAVALPTSGAAFVYRPVAMEPGYPVNDHMAAARDAFNKKLEELNTRELEPIPPVPPGEAEYVGVDQCATCHVQAFDFWKKTPHARAVNTLVTRNKLFDGNCIGCHVTGYRKPGGSVLGKLEYTANVNGTAFTKKLQDVGCEVCHGPGSLHIKNPLGPDGKPHNIQREAKAELCVSCHNAEHSTRFNYDSYIQIITGPGHARKNP